MKPSIIASAANRARLGVLLIAALSGTAGCGQKGPLKPPPATTSPAAAAAPAAPAAPAATASAAAVAPASRPTPHRES